MTKVRKSAAAPVGVISKVLRILEAIQGAPSGLGLKAISDLTGIHKSTAHRFLKHLERENYLISIEDGAYLIGPRFWQMTAHVNHRATLQAVARPILMGLMEGNEGDSQSGGIGSGDRALCRRD
jgi:DNA-binding IclR family transcriptional regulator